ncbi:MAG TPA: hypothetical protein VH351_09940 [Bryobacteraceae bacterium]|nr:hypothetical protein [Bryobacteraceae bacterium]
MGLKRQYGVGDALRLVWTLLKVHRGTVVINLQFGPTAFQFNGRALCSTGPSAEQEDSQAPLRRQRAEALEEIDSGNALSDMAPKHSGSEHKRNAVWHDKVGAAVNFPQTHVVVQRHYVLRIWGDHICRTATGNNVVDYRDCRFTKQTVINE